MLVNGYVFPINRGNITLWQILSRFREEMVRWKKTIGKLLISYKLEGNNNVYNK